jgi:hypothetical protein
VEPHHLHHLPQDLPRLSLLEEAVEDHLYLPLPTVETIFLLLFVVQVESEHCASPLDLHPGIQLLRTHPRRQMQQPLEVAVWLLVSPTLLQHGKVLLGKLVMMKTTTTKIGRGLILDQKQDIGIGVKSFFLPAILALYFLIVIYLTFTLYLILSCPYLKLCLK